MTPDASTDAAGPGLPGPASDPATPTLRPPTATRRPRLTFHEVADDDPDVAVLLAAMWDDIELRYAAPATGAELEPAPAADRPAPPAAPAMGSEWGLDPTTVARPHGALVLARLDGRAVGCGALRPLPMGPKGIGELKRVYVTPTARGRGVAVALIDRLVELATELGYRSLVLETGLRQPEAMALYRRLGWYAVAPYGEYRDTTMTRCFGLDL